MSKAPKKTVAHGAPDDVDSAPQSDVQLTRQALFEQRVTQVYEDVQAGRCDVEEAEDRLVQALRVRMQGRLPDKDQPGLEAVLREMCRTHPKFQELLRRKT